MVNNQQKWGDIMSDEQDEEFSFSFFRRFAKKKEGTITLVPGMPNQLHIATGFTPSKVELCFTEDNSGVPVCIGSHDWFDVRIVPHGFILFVELHSNQRDIQWKAIK